MKKGELEKLLKEINEKIGSVETLQQRASEAGQILDNIRGQLNEINQKTQQSTELLKNSISDKAAVESFLEVLRKANEEASNYKKAIEQQSKEYSELKSNMELLSSNYNELEKLSRNQLGLVSMETLANSFASEAKNLRDSTLKWFKSILRSTFILILVIVGITVWQVYHEGALLRWSFLVRLPIATPVIFYLAFASRQYSRDKRLLEEYSFKTSVARSFESYRKVINEEVSDVNKKTDFIMETVENVYSSPMVNIAERKEEKEEEEEGIGSLEKFLDVGNKLKDIFMNK